MPTKKQLLAWSKKAEPGDEIVYHLDDQPRDETLFEAARELDEAGEVCLFQRRTRWGFSWIAVKVSPEARKTLDALSAGIPLRPVDIDRPHGLTPAEKFQQYVKANVRPATYTGEPLLHEATPAPPAGTLKGDGRRYQPRAFA